MTNHRRNTWVAIGALGLALAASTVLAHPEGGAGMGGMGGMSGMAAMAGTGGGMGGGHEHGMASGHEHGGAGQQLLSPQEQQALHEKMRSARTPEERQALAAANHAEMEKRAREKGIALPQHPGAGMGMGMGMGGGRGPRAGGHEH